MNAVNRITAIALKEWRLNLRFPMEFFFNNLITPVKSALLLICLYSGFFSQNPSNFGNVTKENFISYVLLGSILHSQMNTAIGTFRGKLVMEKYWQTAMATLLSPASIYEVVAGFAVGSGGISLFVNSILLSVLALVWPVSFEAYLMSLVVLFLVALLGFGIGLVGATIGLCYEGFSFAFDYSVQLITFLSCFYYPIQILPDFIQPIVRLMPTFQLSDVLHMLFVGNSPSNMLAVFGYMLTTIFVVIVFAGVTFDTSIRKQGVVGY